MKNSSGYEINCFNMKPILSASWQAEKCFIHSSKLD